MTSLLKNTAWLMALMVLLLACTPRSLDTAEPSEPTSAPTTAPSLNETVGGDTCLATMFVYPGSEAVPEMQGELEDWIRSMETMSQVSGGEIRVYSTGDTPGDVTQFYRKNPPPGAWERTLDQTAPEEVGFIVWVKGDLSAQVFTAVRAQRTLILLGCGSR